MIKVDGFEKTFRGGIGPFSTDNLGAHMIGGYNESFNCLRICRVCMATKDDIQTSVSKFCLVNVLLIVRKLLYLYAQKKFLIINNNLYFFVI